MVTGVQSEPSADSRAGGADVPTTSATSHGRWVVERPAPGLARGEYPWPAWGIAAVGGLTIALGIVYLVIRLRRVLKR